MSFPFCRFSTLSLKPNGDENKIDLKKRIPLEIVGDFVFETGGRIDLPLNKLFLEPIASNFAKCLENTTNHNTIR